MDRTKGCGEGFIVEDRHKARRAGGGNEQNQKPSCRHAIFLLDTGSLKRKRPATIENL